MGEIDPRILLAEMLIGLGITTYENVHAYFQKDLNDDAVLADLMTQLDARIARRSDPPAAS